MHSAKGYTIQHLAACLSYLIAATETIAVPGCILSEMAPGLRPRTLCRDVGCAMRQVIYSRGGVNITATPVEHYTTGGPSALRVEWNGLSFVYSGGLHNPPCPHCAPCRISTPPVVTQRICWVTTSIVEATPLYASVGVGALQVAPCSARVCRSTILHNLWYVYRLARAEGIEGAAVLCRRHPPHAHAQRAG